MEQLRLMNEGQTEHLQNDNEFSIVMTEAPDKVIMKQFFEHLAKDSAAAHNAQLDKLANMML